MCSLLSLRPDFPWSRRCRRACPPPYHNSSLLRNFERGIRRVRRKMRRWADGNRGVALTQFPYFPPLPPSCWWPTSALSTLRYIDPAWSTGSQQDQNITQLPGPCSQSLHVAHIPVTPGKMTQTHDWLLGCVLVVYWCTNWKIFFLANGFGPQPIRYLIPSSYWLQKLMTEFLKEVITMEIHCVFAIASNVWWRRCLMWSFLVLPPPQSGVQIAFLHQTGAPFQSHISTL